MYSPSTLNSHSPAKVSTDMKVVLINTFEKRGGAAVACNRLAHALHRAGIEAHVLTATASGQDSLAIGACGGKWQQYRQKWAFYRERLEIFLQNKLCRRRLFEVSTASDGIDIANHPLVREADVIHLHWINQGFLSLEGVKRLLSLGKPVVWTMHDMWAVTAICHHARECVGYTRQCGNCMFLESTRPNDLSRRIFRCKQQIYATSPIHFVTCSAWLRRQAEKSALLKASDSICNIPNPIDTGYFTPSDRTAARQQLRLPTDKRLILFGAVNAADKRKGVDYFIETLRLLHDEYAEWRDNVELVVFGSTKGFPLEALPYRCTTLGYITDRDKIREMYRAADVYVTPSLEENLPNTIMEAMACGTPCVGFDVGGIPEMINSTCGYVAHYRDARDMTAGIARVLHPANHPLLSEAARQKVLAEYTEAVVAKRYIALYNNLLQK